MEKELFWIDSHAHLSDEGCRKDPSGYLNRAKENGVGRILAISCTMEDLSWNLGLHEQYPWIDVAAGYFPGDVQNYSDSQWKDLYTALQDKRVIAVGEIGLDYHWDKTYTDLQKECFIRQIQWANELGKPVCIHGRDAYEDIYTILKENPARYGVLMHCYSGTSEMAQQYLSLDQDVRFAFGGTLTYKNNPEARKTVLSLPLDRIMLETDSPYLAPQIFRGKPNEAKNVRYVGEFMAELRQEPVERLQEAFIRNYQEFFRVTW